MAAAVVQTVEPRTNSATSVGATFGATPTAGNTIVGFSSAYGSVAALSDNKSNSYTAHRSSSVGSTDVYHLRSSSAVNIASSATFTVTISNTDGDSKCAFVSEISGVTSSPVDVNPAAATGTSAAPAISSGVLAQADEIVLAAASYLSIPESTITQPGAPWSLVGEEEDSSSYTDLNVVSQVVAATSSVTSTWTLGASRNWHAVLLSFKASGGGAAATAPPPWPPSYRLQPILGR